MDSEVMLTLSNWPAHQMTQNRYKLSPMTSKILKSADVKVQSLLPLSREEFVITNNLSIRKKEEIDDLYASEKERRNRKVEILKGLWSRISSKHKKRKSDHSSDFAKKEKMSQSQRNSSKSGSLFKKAQHQKPSPIIFKAREPKKNSAYFDYYSNSKDGKLSIAGQKKYSNEDQSTKSRHNIKERMNSKISPNRDYFGSQQKRSEQRKKNKQNTSLHKTTEICLELLDEMNQAMEKWTQMDVLHREETNQMGDLSQRENKRLMKIQQIEKQKLKQEIEDIRTRLTASKQLGKHFF